MALHREKEDVLLAWINGFRLAGPADNILLLHDGIFFLKFIFKLKGQEEDQSLLDQPIQQRIEFVSDFLQNYCHYKTDKGAMVSWDNILNGKNLDVELSKVVVLLMYHALTNGLVGIDRPDYKTEVRMAAVIRFVFNYEDSLYLSDNLETFLQKPFYFDLSSISSVSSSGDESPVLYRRRRPEVKFLELTTVASTSAGSPILDVLNTPQFQLRKARKQLDQERDMRDDLERELATSSQTVTEREMEISQLQHRIQRLMRDNAEQDQEPKELEELQNKNEGLLKRLHEVLKQCQEFKTNKSQMENKIDQLTEENGNMSVEIRAMVARLSCAQTMVDSLSEEQRTSQAEWESKKMFFETELCQAVSEKESLSEQIQILRGKISILEDEVRKAQTPEQGEVMGPIMEWERLNHEISELTRKLSQLQETILHLEKEKGEMQTQHKMEKDKFDSETSHLQGLTSELQQTLCVLRGERESLEQASREQQATMIAQISAMNAEIACLSEMIRQKELAAMALSQQVAEEQKQRGLLMERMDKQDRINQETIQGLSQQVEHLETTFKSKEEESSRQYALLQVASVSAIQEKDTVLAEYRQFRQEKEEEVLNLNQQVRRLEEQREAELSILSEVRREKEELHLKLVSLESAVRDLQNQLEAESRKHRETLAAKLQKESEIVDLGNRVQQLLAEIELMGQQLNEARQEKLHAESCVEKLKIECRELSNALSAERDHGLHLVKEREAEVEMLSAKVETKTEEVEKLVKETEQYLVELEAIRTAKVNVESHLNSIIEKHQAEICTLRIELTDVQGLVKQMETEKELLQNEISAKEEELKIHQECVLNLQSETAQMEELRQNVEVEVKRHQMAKQDADAGNAAVQLLRITLAEKEDKISTLLLSIKALEEKVCALQDLQKKEIEDYKRSISVLEHGLAEGQSQIGEKVAAFEIQGQQVLSLQKDLSLEHARAVSLEENLKALESDLRNQNMQEQELRREAIVHSEELKKQKADLEKLQQEILAIQEEKQEEKSRALVASEKIEMLQAEVLSVSSLATERNESLAALSIELNCLKEQDVERSKLAGADCKRQEETIEKLHRDVLAASSLASERQDEVQVLLMKVSSLKKELEMQQELNHLKDEETNAMGSKCNELETKVSQLQAQVLEASSLASLRESEVSSLQNDLKERDNLRLQAAETEDDQRKELEKTVSQLQAQVLEASSLASLRESEISSLRCEVNKMDNLRLQTSETEEAQRKELEEKVSQLQTQVLEASSLASLRESEISSLRSEVKEIDNLRLQAAETEEVQRRELEEKVCQLQAQVLEASSLNSLREAEVSSIQNKLKEMDNLRLQAAETEVQRKELEEKVSQFQVQVLEASSLASLRESEIISLRSELNKMDNLRLQASETEEAQRKELEEKVSQLQTQVLEASSLASLREAKVSSIQNKLTEMDNLRLQAAETEVQHKELEKTVSQLQAQVLEASSLASLRESEVSSLQNDLKERDNLRLQAAETEDDQRKELEKTVCQLQAQVLEASSLNSLREAEVSSIQNKLKEMDNLRLQAAETEVQRKELEEKVSQFQVQVLEASSLASLRESEIISLRSELNKMDNLRLQASETEEAQRKELEEKVSQLQTQVLEASSLASLRESEVSSLQNDLKERDNLRLQAAETEDDQRKELEKTVSQLQAQVLEASSLASLRESEVSSLQNDLKERDNLRLQAAETEVQRMELEEKISQLQAQVLESSSLAALRDSEISTLRSEVNKMDNLRLQTSESEEAQCKELEEKVSQLKAQVLEASSLNSLRQAEVSSLQNKLKEIDNLRLQAAETEAQRKELEEKVSQLQAQVLEAASQRASELCSLSSEVKEKDNLRLRASEAEEAQRKALEEKIAQLQAQVLEASSLASLRESEVSSLQNDLKERDNLRLQAAETEDAQRKALEEKVAQLQAQVLEASSLASLRASELCSLSSEVKERDNLRLQASVAEEAQRKELEQKVSQLQAQVREASSVASEREFELNSIQKEMKDKDSLRLQVAETEDAQRRELERKIMGLHELQHASSLVSQKQQMNETIKHYKAQVENAKIHYNGKKQQLLEANEKIQVITTTLETSEKDVKTLQGQMNVLQVELEQAKATEKVLRLNVNSLLAQLDYADKQLRKLKRLGKGDEVKPKEAVYQKATEKQQDTSGDSLDLSLDDSLNSTRRPSKGEESSTPVVRSSERLQAKRRARGTDSLETLYFTPMSVRNAVDGKLESSISSLGELVLDSTKKSLSARRRTTQVINITMIQKTPGRVEADTEDASFYSLQSAQSFPNLASQRGRPLEFSEDTGASDQLQNLPGYRRSAALSTAPLRSTSTFRVGAENEPDHSDDWMRIAELQARNKACLPHLKSSYPLESRPSLGNPSFTVTDDDLRMGDPNETIRRASMMPSQITDSLASHRLSMLPGQIRDGSLSCRETLQPGDVGSRAASQHAALHPKRCASNAQNTRAATLPLKRAGGDLQGPDTPEAKKLASCFPRPMTPKDHNDRRFASQNSQNRPPNTPAERRQSMVFNIENTPKKNAKANLLQKGINKMRSSTRKSPGSTSKIPRSAKSPRPGKSPHGEKPQRRSPRINSNKSPKITSSARKFMNYRSRMKM